MIRWIISGALAALAALSAPARGEPVVVGAALPKSGNLADLAAGLGQALELWREQANAAGGLLGRPIELVLLDDRSDAAASARLYEQLVHERKAELLIGPFGSAASLGAAGAAERNRRVLVNATGSARAVHKAGPRYVFQVPAPFTGYGAGARALARARGLTRVQLLARNDPAAREMAGSAEIEAAALGLTAAPSEVYAAGTTDFAPQIARARSAGAEAWIAFGLAQDAAEMVKSFRKLGYAPRLFVAQGAADPAFVTLLGQDAEHAIGISPYERRAAMRGNAEFARAYGARWSAEPGRTAAEGYAAARVLEEAVRRAGSFDQEKLRAVLAALETETVLGPYRVGKGGAQMAARPVLVQIQKGRREIVWPGAVATAQWLAYPGWQERKLMR